MNCRSNVNTDESKNLNNPLIQLSEVASNIDSLTWQSALDSVAELQLNNTDRVMRILAHPRFNQLQNDFQQIRNILSEIGPVNPAVPIRCAQAFQIKVFLYPMTQRQHNTTVAHESRKLFKLFLWECQTGFFNPVDPAKTGINQEDRDNRLNLLANTISRVLKMHYGSDYIIDETYELFFFADDDNTGGAKKQKVLFPGPAYIVEELKRLHSYFPVAVALNRRVM